MLQADVLAGSKSEQAKVRLAEHADVPFTVEPVRLPDLKKKRTGVDAWKCEQGKTPLDREETGLPLIGLISWHLQAVSQVLVQPARGIVTPGKNIKCRQARPASGLHNHQRVGS
jgi:hypothetical protein